MPIEYRATLKNHLKATWIIIVLVVVFAIACIVAERQLIGLFTIFFLVFALPSVLLYVEYYRWNAKTTVMIDDERKTIHINDKVVLHYDEITQIVIYQSDSVYHNRNQRPLSSIFSYAEFVLSNGKVFYFTSLLAVNIVKALNGGLKDKVRRKPRTWASMYMEGSMLYKVFYD